MTLNSGLTLPGRRVIAFLISAAFWAPVGLWPAQAPQAPVPPPQVAAMDPVWLHPACVTTNSASSCHSKRLQTGGLSLEGLDACPGRVEPGALGESRPETAGAIHAAAGRPPARRRHLPRAAGGGSKPRSTPRPPRIPIPARRCCTGLNRAEYANAIRDLLAPRRRRRVAAAARRFRVRLRQHLRRARRLAVAAGTLSVAPPEDQPAVAVGDPDMCAAGSDTFACPPGSLAGPAHRRAAARHDRRHPRPRTRSRSTATTCSRPSSIARI